MPDIKIGWAQTSITPDRPVFHSGQIYPRVSQYVHDPVTATALALESGDSQSILLSMDITSVPGKPLMDRVRKQLAAELAGFDPQNLSAFATHTHTSVSRAPYIFDESALAVLGKERIALPDLPENLLQGEEFDDFLVNRLVQVAAEAWNRRERGGISSATDYAAIAFNRRPVFERDGKSETRMYGVCARNDFKRYEAGSDHSADMLYTWSPDGRLTGVAVCIPCPSQVFELHSFISADYWHYTRQALRETLGNVFVLPLCGAAGRRCKARLAQSAQPHRYPAHFPARRGRALLAHPQGLSARIRAGPSGGGTGKGAFFRAESHERERFGGHF